MVVITDQSIGVSELFLITALAAPKVYAYG